MVVLPVVRPLTTPVLPTVATAGLLLLHVPPVVVSVKFMVAPTHTLLGPPMAAGVGSTVMVAEPSILFVQPVEVFVPIAVYVPAAENTPKSKVLFDPGNTIMVVRNKNNW